MSLVKALVAVFILNPSLGNARSLKVECSSGSSPVAQMHSVTYPEDPLTYITDREFSRVLQPGEELIFGRWECLVPEGNWGCPYDLEFKPEYYLYTNGSEILLMYAWSKRERELLQGRHQILDRGCSLSLI